jgi:hypothetical protein
LALTTTYYSVSRHPLNALKITFQKKHNFGIVCVLQQQVPLPLPCFNFAQIAIPSLTLKKHRYLGLTPNVQPRTCIIYGKIIAKAKCKVLSKEYSSLPMPDTKSAKLVP